MAADVGRDVALADVALDQFDRGEHRPLGTADAEIRRPRRQRRRRAAAAARGVRRLVPTRPGRDVQVRGMRGEKTRDAVHDHLGRVFARHDQGSLPCSLVRDVAQSARRRMVAMSCSMNSGWPSSTTSTAALPAQKPVISSGTSG